MFSFQTKFVDGDFWHIVLELVNLACAKPQAKSRFSLFTLTVSTGIQFPLLIAKTARSEASIVHGQG